MDRIDEGEIMENNGKVEAHSPYPSHVYDIPILHDALEDK